MTESKQLIEMTNEEVQQRISQMSDNEAAELQERLKNGTAPTSYSVRRKKIYKGKMAPQGAVYIVISMKTKTRKLEAHQVIPGHMGEQFEKGVAEGLRDLIKKKYDV